MLSNIKRREIDDSSMTSFEACARIVARRQKGRILSHLLNGQTSFEVLRRNTPDLSPQSLRTQLRELESDGIVVKQRIAGYQLTELGHSLRPLLTMMTDWSSEYHKARITREECTGRGN